MFAKVTKVLASVLAVTSLFSFSITPAFANGVLKQITVVAEEKLEKRPPVQNSQPGKLEQNGTQTTLGAVKVTKKIIQGTAHAIRYGSKWISWLVAEYGDDEIAYVIRTKSNTIAKFLDSVSVMETAAIEAIKMRLPGVLIKAGVEKGLAHSVSLVVADIVYAATWIL